MKYRYKGTKFLARSEVNTLTLVKGSVFFLSAPDSKGRRIVAEQDNFVGGVTLSPKRVQTLLESSSKFRTFSFLKHRTDLTPDLRVAIRKLTKERTDGSLATRRVAADRSRFYCAADLAIGRNQTVEVRYGYTDRHMFLQILCPEFSFPSPLSISKAPFAKEALALFQRLVKRVEKQLDLDLVVVGPNTAKVAMKGFHGYICYYTAKL